MHFFKHATLRDWNVFLHLYGIPPLHGSDAWFRMAGFCNAEPSKAVLGETLTTEAGESGSYKLGDIHQDSARGGGR